MIRQFPRVTAPVGDHVSEYMDEFGIKAPTLAKKLGVPRSRIVRLLHGARCDGDMALRLGALFGTTAEYWLTLQALHDLSSAQIENGQSIAASVTRLDQVA